VASSNSRGQDTSATNNSTTSTILLQQVPLIDMGSLTYKGFFGGLYPNMSNTVPSAHDTAGLAAAAQIQPLNTSGVADSVNGKIVLLSIGMSNATQDFCTAAGNDGVTCDSWTFSGQASTSLQVNTSTVKIINGARGGQSIEYWDSATTNDAGNSTVNNYELTKTNRLTPNGLTEAQVQVVWLKAATGTNTSTLPNAGADAYYLRTYIGRVARAAKTRYPNLRLMFITSRAFSYDPSFSSLSQEPFTYEGGYAVKWAIEAQIHQMENGGTIVDTEAGDLNYNNGTAPWMAWGPYIWANGTIANSEGTTWAQSDLESDHIHPSQAGETKVGTKLLNFFLGSSYTSSWFVKP
jgi:hypothetical protein